MIDLGSIAGLCAHDHELHAYCQQCDRWVVLDLAAMIRNGHGERRLPITVRCRHCCEIGRLQVRPPMPTRVGAVGWVMPVTADQIPCRPGLAWNGGPACRGIPARHDVESAI